MIDPRFQKINDLFIDFSRGNFDTQIELSNQLDEIDAFISNINMLGEELKSTTISLNYFNNIFHSVSDMIFVLHPDGKINNINHSVKLLLACSEDEIMNTPINKLFPSSQNKLFKEITAQLQQDRKIVSSTIKLKYKSVSIDTQCLFTHLHSEQNENIGFLLIARDVRKIKEYEAKYQKIFQDSSDAIFIMNKDYKLLEINKAGKQLLDLKTELPSILDLCADASEKTNFETALKKNNKIRDFYVKLKPKRNKQIDCLISVNRIGEDPGNLQGIIKDISIQKANETIVINAIIQTEENERKRISSDLHDSLGQQLSAILFYLSTIKGNKKLSPKNVSEILKKSHDAISSAVKELRDICFNIMPRTLENYGLLEAIKELCTKIEKQEIFKFDISFPKTKIELPKSLEITLFRIVQEFINNTIKHANADKVKIKIKLENDFLLIYIQDNGIGFDPENNRGKFGLGLKNMESRLLPYNGKLEFKSILKQGTGCRIKIDLHYLNDIKS